jgi:EmrB/QacA subfamily drug resistance transporter
MRLSRLEYKWLVGIVFVVALFLDFLDASIVVVALPTLAAEFGATTTTIEWVVTGYLLSLAVFIPFSGWLGDRFGTKRVFIVALAVFLAGSLLSGLAWDVESLITFRILQGVGGGTITPVGYAMLWRAFPPSERAAASAVLAIPITLAPALGPLVGGYLVDYHDWRWIFFINLPIGVVGLAAATVLLRESVEEIAGRLDFPGLILSGIGLVSVVYALAEAGMRGFDDTRVIVFGLGGLAVLALFTAVELRTKEPMIDVRLLADSLFARGSVVQFVLFSTQFGAFFILPIYLQAQKGLSPFDVGLITFPTAIGVMLMAQPAARLYPVLGPRRVILVGFAGAIATNAALGLIDYDTSNWLIAANMLVRGVFIGLVIIPVQTISFVRIRPKDMGRASSVFNTSRQVASSLGVAVFATALMNRLDHHAATLGDAATRSAALTSFQETFVFGAALSIIGLAASLSIEDRKVAEAPWDEAIGFPQGTDGNFALKGRDAAGSSGSGLNGRLSAGSVRRAGPFGPAGGEDG